MRAQHIVPEDISELESVLMRNGRIVPAASETLLTFGQNALSVFCHKHGVYQLPTTELVSFLSKEIEGMHTIEIGSGNGVIGRSLGIMMTDNYMQTWPEIIAHYESVKQPVVQYGKDVKEIAANPAVRTYRPKVVVGCWITHLWKEGMKEGNMHGVDELAMFGNGIEKYIHVGNLNTHQHKPILKNKHLRIETYQFPWLLSRSLAYKDNIIHIIKKY